MSTFWSIVRRETDERRLLMLGALALGFLPFAVALIPSQIGKDIGEARLELALVLAGVATGVTAFFLGASVIARDLAERRLSFYFSRPVPNWAIWGGKMTAAVGLSLATGFLIVLPALLTGARPVDGPPPAWLIQAAVVAPLAIVGVAHALSVLLRARSPWLLLDLGAALLVTLIVLAAKGQFIRAGLGAAGSPSQVESTGYLALNAIAILATLAAGAVQVHVGRTDPRRSHKALSLTLWSVLVSAALLFLGFSRWVTQVEPRDLETFRLASSAPAGPWVLLAGPARHRPGYSPAFLFDSSTGRAVRINAQPSKPYPTSTDYPFLFSDDGKRAVWLEAQPFPTYRLLSLDLASPASRPLTTLLHFQGKPQAYALSEDGSRFAAVDQGRLLVYGLPRGELLASVALPEPMGWLGAVEFDSPGHVQLVQQILDADRHEGAVVRHRLEIATQKMTSEDIGRGRFESWLEARMPLGRHTLRFDTQKAGVALIIGDRAGAEQRRAFLPGSKTFYLAGQPTADQVVVGTGEAPPGWNAQDEEVFLLDLAKGTLRPLPQGLRPISMAESAKVGAPATRLFYNETELVRIDPETGQRTTVLKLS